MKTKIEKESDELCDKIEVFLKSIDKDYREEVGALLGVHVAIISATGDDIFAPLKILKRMEEELVATIDDTFLDGINKIVGEYAQKQSKKTNKK